MARHSLTPEVRKAIRPKDKRLSIQTANGTVEVTREADVYINELDTYVYIKLVEDSPAVLSVGRFCNVISYSNGWNTREHPQLTKDGVIIECYPKFLSEQ